MQSAAVDCADPAIRTATVLAVLLTTLCVALVLHIVQLQLQLSRRHAAATTNTDLATYCIVNSPTSLHRASLGRSASPNPLLTITVPGERVPHAPLTPALTPVPEPATIVINGKNTMTPWPLDDIDAYLVDLDGTIYSPNGPIDGAAEFYASVLRDRPHVFLSNTGAKGADGVRQKLLRNGIVMGPKSQSKHIYTAAQAQTKYMADTVPRGYAAAARAKLSHTSTSD